VHDLDTPTPRQSSLSVPVHKSHGQAWTPPWTAEPRRGLLCRFACDTARSETPATDPRRKVA